MTSDDREIEPRDWTCSECGKTLTYPETRVLEHYDTAHGEEYGHIIGWYPGKDEDGGGGHRTDETGADHGGPP